MIKFVLVAVLLVSICSGDHIDKDATVRSFKNDLRYDGSYEYKFETTNGIGVQESGVGGQHATGSAQYYAPDGTLIRLGYYADETGFHPDGEHLPTPPPVPSYILRALEWIRTHPEKPEPAKRPF